MTWGRSDLTPARQAALPLRQARYPGGQRGTLAAMRYTVWIGVLGVLLGNSAVAAPPAATTAKATDRPAGATRASVEAKLAKEGRTLVQADVQAMGKDADLILIDIMRDHRASSALRTRAVDALAASGSAVARDQLVRLVTVTKDEADLPLVRKALLGLGWMGDGRIVANAGPWLDHKSPAVRLDAAVGLALSKNPEAFELLARHNRREKDADVRQQIDRLIKRHQDEHPKAVAKPSPRPRIAPPPPMEGRDSPRR